MTDPVQIRGLRQFSKDLRALDRELPKALRLAMNEAADVVVTDARPRVPRRSGRAARSIRPQSTRTKVRVTSGGRKAPYLPWLDYGGRVGRSGSVERRFIKEGRYVYPAYFAARDRGTFRSKLEAALINVAGRAGIGVD